MEAKKSSIVIFTGEGKGKTTAAMGRALLYAAARRKAVVVQFLKGTGFTGELSAAGFFQPYFTIKQFGYRCPYSDEIRQGLMGCTKCGVCFKENKKPERQYAKKALQYAKDSLAEPDIHLLVLDEISHAVNRGLIDAANVLDMLQSRPRQINVILTGRNMPQFFLDIAQEVSYCHMAKHPFQAGISARRGIEY